MSAPEERYARVFELFTSARAKDAAGRATELASAPEDLRLEVQALLRVDAATQHGQAEDRLRAGVERAASLALHDVAPPERIGPYRIVGVVAHGGQATVYQAEQEDPRRTVALKVLRGPALMPESLRRFEIETKALARLEHPFIAPIFDAGALDSTDGPVRYFAMQWVEGRPLDVHADHAGLDVRGRLALIADVCTAVEHAHRKGIIHRDLKPANILVEDDGRPKVLDFGVARATDSDLVAATLATTTGQVVGTLQFMSPEQISGDPTAIDTRSDVYALGVLLHLLLAGEVPHSKHMHSVGEAARQIQEVTPALLGRRIPALRGDVETIVAKALAKEPDERYGSAASLEADLRRFLQNEPILARPPSALYVFSRFARRRRALVGALFGLALALVAGTIVSSLFAAEAQRKASEAEARGRALRLETSRSRIVAAAAALAAREPRTAKRLLHDVPADLRAWEWNVLFAQVDHGAAPVHSLGLEADERILTTSSLSAGGRLAVVTSRVGPRGGGFRWRRHALTGDEPAATLDLPGGYTHCMAPSGSAVTFLREGGSLLTLGTPRGDRTAWPDVNVHSLLGYTGDGQHVVAVAREATGGYELRLLDLASRRVAGRWPIASEHLKFATAPRSARWAVATKQGHLWIFPAQLGGGAVRATPHDGPIVDLGFAFDGASIVSLGADGSMARTDVRTAETRIVGTVEPMGPGCLAPSPTDGRFAFFVGDGTLRVIDPEHPARSVVLHGHGSIEPTLRPIWAPDGASLITATRSGLLRQWDVARSVPEPYLRVHAGAVLDMAVGPGALRLATLGDDGTVALWDMVNERLLGRIAIGRGAALDWSADGSRLHVLTLIGPTHRRRYTLDAETGALVDTVVDAEAPSSVREEPNVTDSLIFAHGTRRAIATATHGIEIRDAPSGDLLLTLGRSTRRVTRLARLGEHGPLLAGGEDGVVRIWRPWSYADHVGRRAHPSQRPEKAWGADTDLASPEAPGATGATIRIELVATGAEPRLRCPAPTAQGEVLRLAARLQRKFTIMLAGMPIAPVEIPPLSTTLRLTPTKQAGAPRTSSVEGWQRGPATSRGVDKARPRPGEVATLVGALWCPLPTQPIGIGARWRVSRSVAGSSGQEETTGLFELVARSGERLEVRASYVRRSPDLLKSLAGLPKTIRMQATKARESTEATFVLRGDAAVPARVTLVRHVTVEIEVEARGTKPSMGFESRSEIRVVVSRGR